MALKYLYVPSGVQAEKAYGVLPNSANADFSSFSRGSAGSRVDKNGLIDTGLGLGSEEVVNGSFSSDSNWTKGTGWVIANGVATYDGTGGTSNIQQNLSISINTLYEVKITVISNEGTGTNIIEIGNHRINDDHLDAGTYTFYGTSTSGTNFLIYGRSGEEFVIDNVSVREVTEVNTDVPRLDYTGGGCPSLLLEPTSTNYLKYSEDFSNSSWAKQSGGTGTDPVIISNNTISPDGTQNADKVVFNKGTGTNTSDLSILSASFTSQSNTASFYVKADSLQRIVVRNSNTWVGYDIGTEWTRIEKTDTGGSLQIGLRDGYGVSNVPNTATVYLWGAQVEPLSYATSYIPNYGTSAGVTRSADVGGSTGDISSEFDSTEGTFFFEGSFSDFSSANRVSLNSSVTEFQDRISISTDSTRFLIIYEAGDVGGSFPVNVSDIYANVKIAVKWSSGSVVCYTNGTESFDRTNIGDFSQNSLDRVTLANANESLPFKGRVKQFRVYDEALSDTELQELTTL